MNVHDIARKFLSTDKVIKWTDAKKSAVFEFADWIIEQPFLRKSQVNTEKRRPAQVFHPGDYLQDELNERNLSDVEFSQMTGIPLDKLRQQYT